MDLGFQTQTCHSLFISDNNKIDNINYQGYPLRNYGVSNIYSRVTVDECQYLCELSDLCRYFNYAVKNSKNEEACYLKFGVGRRADVVGAYGHKYSTGKKLNDIYFGHYR